MSSNPPICYADQLRSVQVGVRPELTVSRHIFRGLPAYVVQDPITFAAHELSVSDYQVFIALESEKPLGATFEKLVDRKLIAPEQEEQFYHFVVRLNQLGLLSLPISDGKMLYERFQKKRETRRRGWFMNLLFLRIPLFQPDWFLATSVGYVAPLFSRAALILWIAAFAVSSCLVGLRWQEFSSPLGSIFAMQNLPVLWGLLVALKVVHEFGHAYACKHFGGRVPEMGVYLMLFTPCAYVDASASWGFTNRFHRLVVSLAGVYFESAIAFVALFVWCMTDPGALHSTAQYAVVLSTFMTVGFNINPLMKYDGYYVLVDLVNLPNLRQRATSQVHNVLKRLLFGIVSPPVLQTLRGRFLLGCFGVASTAYKVLLVLGISVTIATRVPLGGIGIAVAYFGNTIRMNAARFLRFVFHSEQAAPVRGRVLSVTCAIVVLGFAGLLFMPTPGAACAVGFVGRSGDHVIRAAASGFVQGGDRRLGDDVEPGAVLGAIDSPESLAERDEIQGQIEFLHIKLHREAAEQPIAAATTEKQLRQAREQLARLTEQLAELTIRAPLAGKIVTMEALSRPGRFVNKGEPLATISSGKWVVDALVNEHGMANFRPSIGDRVEVRMEGHWGDPIVAQVIGLGAAGTRQIDQVEFTHLGGGDIPVSGELMAAENPFFQIRLLLPEISDQLICHGMKAQVIFPGQREPLGLHLYRSFVRFFNQLDTAR